MAPSKLATALFCALALRLLAQTATTLAGGGAAGNTQGSTNGDGSAALFNAPGGLAVDTSGAVYVVETTSHRIRLIYPNRTVATLAGGGAAGTTSGSTNGVGTAALLDTPSGVAVDTSGAVFVTDSNSHRIRLIYPNRTVVAFAGGGAAGTTFGSNDGVGSAALFRDPIGVAVGTLDALYVTDRSNNKVRLIFPNRTVITLAGGGAAGTTSGSTNGVGSAALFNVPISIAVGASGAVYVADALTHSIRLIYPNRTVITLAGGGAAGTTSGSTNGVGSSALFNRCRPLGRRVCGGTNQPRNPPHLPQPHRRHVRGRGLHGRRIRLH